VRRRRRCWRRPKAREEREARSRERYQRGELFLDMNDMRGELEHLGLSYIDYQDAGL
jgi:hypothetical protein